MPYTDPSKQKQAQHESYLRNKEEVLRKARERKRADRAWVASLKEGKPCIRCGIEYPACVLDFHHIDPSTKVKHISNLISNASRKRVEEEIAKCELICANCHRIDCSINTIYSTLGYSNFNNPALSSSGQESGLSIR